MTRWRRIVGLSSRTALGLGLVGLAGACSSAGEEAPGEAASRLQSQEVRCVTIQRGLFGTVEDTHIADVKPTSNWGTSAALTAGAVPNDGFRQGLLRFDTSFIPPGATVTQATATLNILLYGGGAVRAHRVTAPWSETATTWQTFGGAYAPTVEATFPAGSPTSADLTALVQAWVNGTVPNDGILLERDLDGSNVFASSEYTQAMRPALAVCYRPGPCTGEPDGTACDDGNACTQTDTCQAGLCVGQNPVACAAPDACHQGGACDPATGACTVTAAPNGTPCDDGSVCTQTDTCQGGACIGSNPLSCAPAGQCQNGPVCDAANGCTYTNQPDGTPCAIAGDPNAHAVCQLGACTVLPPVNCSAGHADCDGNATNGCEASTNTDASNCGVCGNVCGAGLVCKSLAWQKLSPSSSPSPQYGLDGHAMAYDAARGKTVLFGGGYSCGSACGYQGVFNAGTWLWDGTSWTVNGASPPLRSRSAMAYDSARAKIVLFGGYTGNGINDTWEWDGTSWTKRTPATSPGARYDHAMAYDSVRGKTVLFGGSSGSTETWEWDGNNWTKRTPATTPVGGSAPKAVFDSARGKTVLFDYSGHTTWEWDGTNWTLRNSTGPGVGAFSAMVYDSTRGRTVLFGGISALTSTWEWDGTSWTLGSASGPMGRWYHAMAYDSARRNVVLYGGYGTIQDYLSDTWVYWGNSGACTTGP